MPWHLWGWWSTASAGACWTLRGGDANRDGHGWPWMPWMAMEIDEEYEDFGESNKRDFTKTYHDHWKVRFGQSVED